MNNKIVYVNNNVLGYFDKDVYMSYSKDEKTKLFKELENQIIKKDNNRKLSSLIIGLSMVGVALILLILMLTKVISLGDSQWFTFTFVITGLFILWVLFYYLFGFIFYKKIHLDYYFKSKKTSNPNSALLYASSNYCKWVNQYSTYLNKANFTINNKPKELVSFGLTKHSLIKNLIFNGKISSNIPYYYMSIKNQKILFLPGMVIVVDGKNSMVLEISEFKVIKENKTYLLYGKDKLINKVDIKDEFNINFFYFKYEQL
jgi:hypothetical protein